MTNQFDSANEIQRWALAATLNNGHRSSPRGQPTRELLSVSFTLTKPRDRCVSIPERRWSLPLAVGEFSWHAAGSDQVDFIAYYAKRWRDFSDDGVRITGSCYGKKMFAISDGRSSQWSQVVDLLRCDPDSRRAVLYFQDANAPSLLHTRDIACATSMQFLVRDGALHAVVNMRSNDAVWGLPYDLFVFTMFQELMAATLGMEIGFYYHVMSSLHLYERHFELAERVLEGQQHRSRPMPPMVDFSQLHGFLEAEERLRIGARGVGAIRLNPYWSALVEILKGHRSRRLSAQLVKGEGNE
jgi:thymidylate synthase